VWLCYPQICVNQSTVSFALIGISVVKLSATCCASHSPNFKKFRSAWAAVIQHVLRSITAYGRKVYLWKSYGWAGRGGYRSWCSAWLRAGRSGDRMPVWVRFSGPVQTGPGTHLASYTMGTVQLPGVKWPGCGANHSSLSGTEVKERVEIHFYYYPSAPSVIGWNLPYRHELSILLGAKWNISLLKYGRTLRVWCLQQVQ
jgi:hypothetical protein